MLIIQFSYSISLMATISISGILKFLILEITIFGNVCQNLKNRYFRYIFLCETELKHFRLFPMHFQCETVKHLVTTFE